MKTISLLASLLSSTVTFAQVSDDQHWFYDDTDHRGEGFAMLSTATHMYMGGLFISAGGNVNTEDLTRWNYATEAWEVVPGLSPDIGGRVDDIFEDDDGFLYFGGNLAFSGGTDARRIVRFNPDTEEWAALSDPSSNLANPDWDNGPINGRVLAIEKDDQFIYVGGNFTDVDEPGTENERYVLRYRLGTGGSVSTGKWEPMASGTGAPVDDLLLLPNGDLIAATRNDAGLMRWDGNSWSAYAGGIEGGNPGGGMDSDNDAAGGEGFIRAMARHPDGRIFVGGSFSSVGASNLTANFVAAYNPTNGTWDNLDGGFGGSYVQSNGTPFVADGIFDLKIDSQGLVYVAGDIQSTVDGPLSNANHVAVWDDSGSWKSLGSGLGSTGSQIANCIGITPDDSVFIGGVFSRGWELSKSASNRVAIWDADAELSVIPNGPTGTEIRIEDGRVVLYFRTPSQVQFRIRSGETPQLSSSDSNFGPFLVPRFLISRRDLEPFDPNEPKQFYVTTIGSAQ